MSIHEEGGLGNPNAKQDRALLAAATSKREVERRSGFERLLDKYEKLIWHVARRYFDNGEDAKDACQDAALKIWSGLPNVRLPESGTLKSWICAVTAHACLDALRKRKLAAEVLPDADDPSAAAMASALTSATGSAEDEALARIRADEILRAIAALPDDYRTILILRDLNALSYQELAEAVGAAPGTVKSRLSRAREALRKSLDTAALLPSVN